MYKLKTFEMNVVLTDEQLARFSKAFVTKNIADAVRHLKFYFPNHKEVSDLADNNRREYLRYELEVEDGFATIKIDYV